MLLKKAHIRNFKGINQIDIEYEKGVNLLIGDNGSGKTSILSAMSVPLGVLVNNYGGLMSRLISNDDVRIIQKKIGDSTYEYKEAYPVEAVGLIDDGLNQQQIGAVIRNKQDMELGMLEYKGYLVKALGSQEGEMRFPLISFQRFDREWEGRIETRNKSVTVMTGLVSREEGYNNCLNGASCVDQIQQWCLKMAFMEYERKTIVKEFHTFQSIIERFFQFLNNNRNKIRVYYSTEFNGLMYDDGETSIPIFDMSSGYRSLLSMVMELAYRAVILNPEISDDLRDLEGIVLIDEIDAHLHPKWQWRVLDAVEEVFPSVQFIVATHSPMVISSAKKANIINIDNKTGVNYLESAYGFSAGDVLTLRQGTEEMPEESKEYLEKLERALDDNDIEHAKDIVDQVKNRYGEESAFYNELYQNLILNSLVEG